MGLAEDIATVMQQTGVDNREVVEATLRRHENNVVDTICDILGMPRRAATVEGLDDASPLGEVRRIVCEKEAVFHEFMRRTKKSSEYSNHLNVGE